MSTSATTAARSPHKLFLFLFVIVIRILVGFSPHSGQDNYHGNHAAYGGDFEAQRHWMELTWSLPMGDWYWYDLSYWGLDYPPLTAYQSWVCGGFSYYLVGPHTVELETSRGLEDEVHKAYMRMTVLVLDLAVYGSAAYFLTKPMDGRHTLTSLFRLAAVLAQPALLLIDHGHFQYNTAALGLSLWSFYFAVRPGWANELFACFLFTCALSFKQMTLYYAPAIFAYLLGKCCSSGTSRAFWRRFVAYGVTVVTTIILLWWPFVMYGPRDKVLETMDVVITSTTPLSRIQQVLHRIFPVQRGLFEDKVANLWCALSLRPLRLAHRIPVSLQPLAALGLTLMLILPACWRLFSMGLKSGAAGAVTSQYNKQQQQTMFLWGASGTALSFFLGAFHTHEKSILLPLAPATLVLDDTALDWLAVVATWSLYPLLILDRLQVTYICTLIIYVCTRHISRVTLMMAAAEGESKNSEAASTTPLWLLWTRRLVGWGSALFMLALHALQALIQPPAHLPDIFAVLWAVTGCAFFVLLWLAMAYVLYKGSSNEKDEQQLTAVKQHLKAE